MGHAHTRSEGSNMRHGWTPCSVSGTQPVWRSRKGEAYGSVLLASTPIRKNRRLTYSTRSSSRIGNVHALRPGPNAGGEVVAERWMVRLNLAEHIPDPLAHGRTGAFAIAGVDRLDRGDQLLDRKAPVWVRKQMCQVAEADRVPQPDRGTSVHDRPVFALAAEDLQPARCVCSARRGRGCCRRFPPFDLVHRVVLST